MRRTARTFLLLLMMVALISCFALHVSAAAFESTDDALEYLDGYSDNVGTDPDFEENVDAAIETVRQDISIFATFLALLPPIIAIALALITKEVYSSLFVGILSGALLYSNGNVWNMFTFTFDTMIGMLSDSWNVGILIFLVVWVCWSTWSTVPAVLPLMAVGQRNISRPVPVLCCPPVHWAC